MIARRYAVVATDAAGRLVSRRLYWTAMGARAACVAANAARYGLGTFEVVDLRARRRETGADL